MADPGLRSAKEETPVAEFRHSDRLRPQPSSLPAAAHAGRGLESAVGEAPVAQHEHSDRLRPRRSTLPATGLADPGQLHNPAPATGSAVRLPRCRSGSVRSRARVGHWGNPSCTIPARRPAPPYAFLIAGDGTDRSRDLLGLDRHRTSRCVTTRNTHPSRLVLVEGESSRVEMQPSNMIPKTLLPQAMNIRKQDALFVSSTRRLKRSIPQSVKHTETSVTVLHNVGFVVTNKKNKR